MKRRRMLVWLLAVVAAGCRLDATTTLEVARDGGGEVAVDITVDDELRDVLVAAGQDPAAALPVAAGGAWSATPVVTQGATGQRLAARFDDPAALGATVEALRAGLDPDDGALLRDVELTLDEATGYRLVLSGGIEPPAVAGTAVPGQDQTDLAALLAERGDEVATATLRVTFPTTPTVVVGTGTVEGTTAVVALPVGELAQVELTAPPPATPGWWPSQEQLALGAVGLGVVALALALWAVRRR